LKFAAAIGSTTVFGEVRAENYPSRHIFESLGFERQLIGERSMLRYRSVI
jgi:RimJ/RimL family protein N-acetyltransferase